MVFRFVLAILATWRVSRLLATERGPWDLIARLRTFAGSNLLGRLMDCFNCVSLWVAAPLAFYVNSSGPVETVVTWLGLSGGAILVEAKLSEPRLLEGERTVDDMLQSPPAAEAEPKLVRDHEGIP